MLKKVHNCIFTFAIIALLTLISTQANAALIYGQGFGKTIDASESDALSDLASIVKVRVYSKYEKFSTSSNGKENSQSGKFTRIITDVPLISPKIETTKVADGYISKAYIDDISPYEKKLQNISNNINDLLTKVAQSSDDSVKYDLLMKALPLYDEYDSYANIMDAIGVENYEKPKLSYADILYQVTQIRQMPSSLDMAATALTYGIDERNIYVDVPYNIASEEATEFGIFFKKLLESKVKSVKLKQQSNYTMSCTYADVGNYLQVVCSLVSGATTIVKSSTVEIPKGLLINLAYEPKNRDVTNIINNQYNNEDLRVAIRVVSQSGSLVVKEGEKFSIQVKVNEPSFVYIAGYAGNRSNILELGLDGSFYRFISSSKKGEWIDFGNFTASQPFGAVTLQAFAVEEQPTIAMLPRYAWDNFDILDVKGDKLANDLLSLYNKLKTKKAYTYTTVTTVKE